MNAFILKRQKDVLVVGEGDEHEERKYSNGEINRELTLAAGDSASSPVRLHYRLADPERSAESPLA